MRRDEMRSDEIRGEREKRKEEMREAKNFILADVAVRIPPYLVLRPPTRLGYCTYHCY
jgi:hypothetical protein